MSARGTSVAGACSSTARLLQSNSQAGARACRAAVAGPPPCSPETGRSGHVERRRTIPQVVKGTLETMTERTQVIDVTVPQTTEEERISQRVHEQIVDMPVPIAQPGDQACRGSADAVPRQGCRYTCRDANQVTKHAEFTQNLYIDKSVDLRVVMQ